MSTTGGQSDIGGVVIEFAQFGDFDSFTIYRNDTPMDIASLPAPIAAGLTTMYYVDSTIVGQQDYYYRVGVVRDGAELVSDEIQYLAPKKSSIPTDTILHYPFNGNVLDISANALDGIKTGTANFVAGRKAGTQAIEFIAGGVRTPKVLPINSDKLTVSFHISTSQTSFAVIYESSNNINSNNGAVSSSLNNGGNLTINSVINGDNPAVISRVNAPILFDKSYQHVIIEIDRLKGVGEKQKIYIDNVLKATTYDSIETPSNFSDHILYIGYRSNGTFRLQARIQDMRWYNRILSEAEKTALFNE